VPVVEGGRLVAAPPFFFTRPCKGLSMKPTDGEKELPTIHIGWDAESQQPFVKFDPAEIKTWDLFIAMCDMAKRWGEMKARENHAMQVRQQMAQAAHNDQIAKQIFRG
jgi:hypothetical protein